MPRLEWNPSDRMGVEARCGGYTLYVKENPSIEDMMAARPHMFEWQVLRHSWSAPAGPRGRGEPHNTLPTIEAAQDAAEAEVARLLTEDLGVRALLPSDETGCPACSGTGWCHPDDPAGECHFCAGRGVLPMSAFADYLLSELREVERDRDELRARTEAAEARVAELEALWAMPAKAEGTPLADVIARAKRCEAAEARAQKAEIDVECYRAAAQQYLKQRDEAGVTLGRVVVKLGNTAIRVAELEAALRWIPTGDELPPVGVEVEANFHVFGRNEVDFVANIGHGKWRQTRTGFILTDTRPTHWRHVPKVAQ